MSDNCGMWNLPWHALQKNLAYGGATVAHPAAALRAVNLQIGAVGADSWLGRARQRMPPVSPVEQ